MKRIRYKKVNGLKVSIRSFTLADGVEAVAVMNESSRTFSIVNKDDHSIVLAKGKGRTLHNVQIELKRKLVDLGFSFDEETREHTSSLLEDIKRDLELNN